MKFTIILRNYSKNLILSTAELEDALSSYFEHEFIATHKPWKAIIGNKKCEPIPLDSGFCYITKLPVDTLSISIMPKEMLIETLKKLGFIVSQRYEIGVLVPSYKKGETLTFAQKWAKRINDEY